VAIAANPNKIAESPVSASTKNRRLLPSRTQYQLWFALGSLILALRLLFLAFDSQTETLDTLSWVAVLGVILVLVVDASKALQLPRVWIQRHLPSTLAVNRWAKVQFEIRHDFTQARPIRLHDSLPSTCASDTLPATALLKPGHTSSIRCRIKPLARGPLMLSRIFTRLESPWRLWLCQDQHPLEQTLRVYPDYSVVAAYKLLAKEQETAQLGIKKRRRRGEGSDFQQLREYRPGDAMRSIHWKATARRQQLISKEYQEARDQRILLLLDTGQRMRAKDGDLSHFDQALNAVLLLSYIALRQGDSVAVQSFGPQSRWLAPQQGSDKLQVILNALYDLNAQPTASDYLQAATLVANRQPKRSLVLLITNTRDEDSDDLQLAVKQLQRSHVVLVADLQEIALHQAQAQPITSLQDALQYASLQQFQRQHQILLQTLKSSGVYHVSVTPKMLAAQLANHYLAIKRAGVL
jgi:uncharacterized protein (DUF58 family)